MKLRIDLHVHSQKSKDSEMTLKEIEEAALEKGLDGVAITDHNHFEVFRSKKIIIVPGEEIATDSGEVIGLGIKKEIERGLSPQDTIKEIHRQSAIAVAPHPFDSFRQGLGNQLHRLDIDAVETWNARCLLLRPIRLAQNFAREKHLPRVGGSDGHTPSEVGNAYTEIECPSPEAIIQAIKSGNTRAVGHLSSPLVHFSSFKARLKKGF